MRIVDMKVTDGPNYWSVTRKQLVVMTLDLEELEDLPTHKIPGFYDRLQMLLPSLHEHRCSEGIPGGFFQRVIRGTWLGHVIEHIALEIQTLAGIETGFGRTRNAGRTGLYHVVFSCLEQSSGKRAGEAAVRIAQKLVRGEECQLEAELSAIRYLYNCTRLGPSTQAIVDEAQNRNIPVLRLNDDSLVQLGYGSAQQRIEAALAGNTSHIAVTIASDKAATKKILATAGIPVPEGFVVTETEAMMNAIDELGYPVVIKPLDGNHGKGVTTGIKDEVAALGAFGYAVQHSDHILVEQHVTGDDHRILLVDYKVVAAARRTPPFVTGDGSRSITELVEAMNKDPRRGTGHENLLTVVKLDEVTIALLKDKGLSPASVPFAGQQVNLKATANLSTGGTATDVTDTLHPDNIAMFERAARTIGLNICGIDVVANDLCTPITNQGGRVVEVNAGPGLRMHLNPSAGDRRNVAAPIIDMLFPDGRNGHIPIIAVTGTNGKTTTTRLIAHIMQHAGYRTGYCTTSGIYIGESLIEKGDCTGPLSARTILKDPSVDCAVLECARGGILRGGLGFDQCDTAVITNIAEDHLGLSGIDSLEKLARVKAVVAEAVCGHGHAVLNADDERVWALHKSLGCGVILFSMHSANPHVKSHCAEGGTAVIYNDGDIVIRNGNVVSVLGPAAEIPVCFGGKASFNIANTIAAAAAAFAQGIPPEKIFAALRVFQPSASTLPGRMNLFDFNDFKVIVDYAHNTHGLNAVADYLRSLPAAWRVGVIAGVGDRRDADILSLGREAAGIFDEIIIRHDKDLRGRDAEEITNLLTAGVREVTPDKAIKVIPDETAAVTAVIDESSKGTVAVIFADDIPAVINQVNTAHAARQEKVARPGIPANRQAAA